MLFAPDNLQLKYHAVAESVWAPLQPLRMRRYIRLVADCIPSYHGHETRDEMTSLGYPEG